MILIVDDKPENIIALKKSLEFHEFKVDTALSGRGALKKLLRNPYELIILDVQMPEMDGFEVAEAIKGMIKTSDIPIIFLSAVSISKDFITKGYASGGYDYLIKPFDLDILILKIRTYIKLYRQSSELIRIQSELIEEIEQRKQAESKKDEFISIASHELKTPLTSVKGYVQLAEVSLQSGQSENALSFLEKSTSQINKLDKLIVELLDISKISAGKMEYSFARFDFETFLASIVDLFHKMYPNWKIRRQGSAAVEISGDSGRLEQVLLNFLSNAVKYSADKTEIDLLVEQDDTGLKVSVRDYGIGISKEDHPRLFQKFYRVQQSSNKYQGLGIGLYIVAEIIEGHGGTYGVESSPGEGSTFYFKLPLAQQMPR